MHKQENPAVEQFLAGLEHPLKAEILALRKIILSANAAFTEVVKWNAPSFCFKGEDRVTMKVMPPRNIQLIFHRGAKVQSPPAQKLINDASGFLAWKGNDRAVATFNSMEDVESRKALLVKWLNDWVKAAE